jgi:hypothetical protein
MRLSLLILQKYHFKNSKIQIKRSGNRMRELFND